VKCIVVIVRSVVLGIRLHTVFLSSFFFPCFLWCVFLSNYRGADKSLARPTSRCILFVGENISFDASLVVCINNTNIPPIMIINRI